MIELRQFTRPRFQRVKSATAMISRLAVKSSISLGLLEIDKTAGMVSWGLVPLAGMSIRGPSPERPGRTRTPFGQTIRPSSLVVSLPPVKRSTVAWNRSAGRSVLTRPALKRAFEDFHGRDVEHDRLPHFIGFSASLCARVSQAFNELHHCSRSRRHRGKSSIATTSRSAAKFRICCGSRETDRADGSESSLYIIATGRSLDES